MGGLISSFMGGITSLISGPKSRGNPATLDDPQKIAKEQGITSAYRAEIVRRNQQRTSSTRGTGADFIAQLEGIKDTGPMHEPDPIEEVEVEEVDNMLGGKGWLTRKMNAKNQNSNRNPFGSTL